MTPCGTFLNYSAGVHDNPTEGYCQILAANVVHVISWMLLCIMLHYPGPHSAYTICVHKGRRPCVFLIIEIGHLKCWTLCQLFMSSPLSQTFVMFSSEIQVVDT